MMRLYLRNDLVKSESGAPKPVEPKHTGETRGGDYTARTQIGYESDGSPRYRYFKTQEEYQKFLTENKKNAKDIKDKVGDEHKESNKKQKESHALLSGNKTEKSLRLFVRG